MNSIFSIQDWFIICIYIFILSIITALPDLYSLYKNKKLWIPINFPPYISGDDYHYFSILNFIHRRFLNLFFKYKLSFPKLTATSKFQFFGFLFNLPAYHLGFFFQDRRYGVLFVRIWNNICLGISFFLLFFAIVNLLEIETEIFYSALTSYVAFLLLYPGPFRRQSIILNLNKNTHIQKYERANDLFRGMFSSTSAPLYLLSSSLLIYSHTIIYSDPVITLLVVLLIPILFFVYLPIAVVYGATVILSSLWSENFIVLTFSIIILIFFIFFYILTVRKDEVGKELYAHSNAGKIFIINFPLVVRIIIIMIPCFLIAIYFISKQILFMGLLVLFLGSMSFTFFFKKHQVSRFYDRGSCILLQAITVIILFIILENTFSLIVGIFFCTLLVTFFFRQAVYLYKNSITICSYSVYKRMNFPYLFSKLKNKSNLIVTDNFIISGLVDAFSSDETLLRNYSLQSFGYKKHIENICKNFRILGYTRKDLIKILCSKVDIYDCATKYRLKSKNLVLMNCNHYYMQYILCNREFNNQIIIDGMYDSSWGWSQSFEEFITHKFRIAENKKNTLPLVII
jgi:hypothetical protein